MHDFNRQHISLLGIFLICISISLHGVCQTPNSKIVNASMPVGTTALTKEQAAHLLHANFRRPSMPLNKDNYYRSDGLIVSFWDVEENPGFEKSLEDLRSGIIGLLKENKDSVNFSKIIKVNEMNFLVYEYQKDGEVHLWFQTDFRNNKHFGGVIEFKETDEEKAHEYLDKFLKNVHFKD
jgi:hypothetical protein